MASVFAFVGRHNSGKTTLLTQVIKELTEKGIRVGVIKHAYHKLNIPDKKDGEKLFNAGASVVTTDSADVQITYSRDKSKSLSDKIREMASVVDIIILEGYKNENYPKIEVIREAIDSESLPISNVIAQVKDNNDKKDTLTTIKSFGFNEAKEIAEFLINYKQKNGSLGAMGR